MTHSSPGLAAATSLFLIFTTAQSFSETTSVSEQQIIGRRCDTYTSSGMVRLCALLKECRTNQRQAGVVKDFSGAPAGDVFVSLPARERDLCAQVLAHESYQRSIDRALERGCDQLAIGPEGQIACGISNGRFTDWDASTER